MTAASTTSKGPIHLQYDGGQVVVIPEDEDRFVLASRQAVSACQSAVLADRAISEFKTRFLGKLHAWCQDRQNSVFGCYVPFPVADCFKVFIVAKSNTFDFDLSDSIADLESEFYGDGWTCDILQITSGSDQHLQAFFDPERSIKVF